MTTTPASPLRAALDSLREATADAPSDDDIFSVFLEWVEGTGIEPYPAQEEAVMEIAAGANVVLATPTGSGKSLVALGAHFAAASRGERSYYTAPIKALVSEKFFSLCKVFGADMVGMATGDASVNADAPIICCTAEVLAISALREGRDTDVGTVIMDEFHYYGDRDRGWAWQVPLLELPQAQFLLMSATLGDTDTLRKDISKRTGRETTLVSSSTRPVPLSHWYATTPLLETLTENLETGGAPIYVVHFTQAAALERAQSLMSVNMCSKDEKKAIADAIGSFRFTTGFGKTLSRLVRHGVGVHHAGMLPKYRRLVEQLAQEGLLKVICGTDTLGVGINVPIRTVLMTGLTKYDGTRVRQLSAREFHQIAGRAGRAGFDTAGTVVVQAPEHEVENLKAFAKAASDPKKKKKLHKKKAPEGFVNWTTRSHEKLIEAAPEPLSPTMQVSHTMLLNVIARPGNAFEAMRNLLRGNHLPRKQQNKLIIEAVRRAKSLIAAGIVEMLDEPDADGRIARLTSEVPEHFALNQPLSPFALAALEVLDPEEPTHFLDVVSVFEATLDDPRPITSAQLNAAKGAAVAAMKADGVEYEERMEALEEISYPKPLQELLESTYDIYAQTQPWILDFPLKPKSVVREMWERAMTFNEYVSFHKVGRAEGIVLRYLADAYRTLRSSVPAAYETEEFERLRDWLGETVRQTDSSLLDEWGDLVAGEEPSATAATPTVPGPQLLTDNETAFTTMVRNTMWRRIELFAREDAAALGEMDGDAGWPRHKWDTALDEYFDEYDDIILDADARSPRRITIRVEENTWVARQVISDPDGNGDWAITAVIDLGLSNDAGEPVISSLTVGDQ